MKKLYQQPFFVMAACFAVFAASIITEQNLPIASPFVLVLAAFVSIIVPGIKDKAAKTLCYFTLGFTSYWLVGNSFLVPFGEEWRLFSFIPFLFLGIANATAALIGYADGRISGSIFAGASVIALLISRGPIDFNSVDRFLIGISLFAVSSFLYVHFISRTEELKKTLWALAKSTLAASVLLAVVFAIRFFDISVLDPEKLGLVLSEKFVNVFVNIIWFSIVSNGFFAGLAILLYNIALYSFDYSRELNEDGEVTIYRVEREEEPSESEEERTAEKDPYAHLLGEMRVFLRDAKKYDRIKAVETVNRFKEAFNVLAAKYDTPSKKTARDLLKSAERIPRDKEEVQ